MAPTSSTMSAIQTASRVLASVAVLLSAVTFAIAQPRIAPAYQDHLLIHPVATIPEANITQMAWGPDRRLYVMTANRGVHSFIYNINTGEAHERRLAVEGIAGIGIAFHKHHMYVTTFDGAIVKLDDKNKNGVWGEKNKGELRVPIVTGIPQGDHNINQLLVRENSLYVGIGRRTINGRRGPWTMGSGSDDPNDRGFWAGGTGFSWGDCAYGGTIAYIPDLTTVVNEPGSANTYANTTLTRFLIQEDDSPYSILIRVPPQGFNNKLLIHSAGTRNPFGLCLDDAGHLWFTSNFNRTNTLGNGQAGFGLNGDLLDADFRNDVHDQVFKASPGADYGYWDDNWRPKAPPLNPSLPDYHRVESVAFDNLFNTGPFHLHNPAEPNGLGPHASATGCDFWYALRLPEELRHNIFVTRWNGAVTESDGGNTLVYRDLVAVNPSNKRVRRIAQDFGNPIDVLRDSNQRLLVADFANGRIYAIRPVERRLAMHATLVRDGNILRARVTLTNTGDALVTNIRIHKSQLHRKPTATPLPIVVGNLEPNAVSEPFFLNFVSDARSGTTHLLNLYGSHNGVSFFLQRPVLAP